MGGSGTAAGGETLPAPPPQPLTYKTQTSMLNGRTSGLQCEMIQEVIMKNHTLEWEKLSSAMFNQRWIRVMTGF